MNDEDRKRALQTKTASYHRRLENRFPLFPGAAPFIASASLRYPLAIASGASREEIENTLEATGLNRHFLVVVAAEDFSLGKPHPESFLLALQKLNAALARKSISIMPDECLVIEDSIGGVAGARAAGMLCLAVSNSYPPEKLREANRVVRSLEEVRVESLPALFDNPA